MMMMMMLFENLIFNHDTLCLNVCIHYLPLTFMIIIREATTLVDFKIVLQGLLYRSY